MRALRLSAFLVLLLSCSLWAQVAPPSAPSTPKAPMAEAKELKGKLVEKEGTKHLYLWGSAEERGYAEGYLMGDVIFATLEEFALSKNVVPNPMMWDAAIRPLVEATFAFDADFESWAKGVIEGITAKRKGQMKVSKLGRDLQLGDLKVVSCIPDLAGFMCSSFAAWGESTKSGATIVGRNLDYYGTPTMTKNSLIKINAARPGHAAWVGIGWAGVAGCLTGYSESGAWIAIHDVYMKPEKGKGKFTSRMFALEEILTTAPPTAKAPEAALSILRKLRFALGCNGMLAWDGGEKERGATVLEFDSKQAKEEGAIARLPAQGETFIACSNHHRERSDEGHNCWRYGRLKKGVTVAKGDDQLDLPAAWKLIRQSSMDMTIYRTVADLSRGRIEVERRLEPGKDVWSKRLVLDAKSLFREINKLAQ
jgi:hypothetical protein